MMQVADSVAHRAEIRDDVAVPKIDQGLLFLFQRAARLFSCNRANCTRAVAARGHVCREKRCDCELGSLKWDMYGDRCGRMAVQRADLSFDH